VRRALAVALASVALGACPDDAEGGRLRDSTHEAADADVASAPDTTSATGTSDTLAPLEVDTEVAPDATTDGSDATSADADGSDGAEVEVVDDAPAVVTCATPSFIEQYPPPFPPFPYGQWPVVSGCLDAPHDVIIVLGCPSESDGDPAPCQKKRAEIADQLYEAGWAERLIVTGAAVHTPYVEADALAALLVLRGVPDAAIVREPLARHTDENIYYATRIMQREGWRSAIVVSEDPGHLMFTGLCDANCCVGLGRMTLVGFPVAGLTVVNAGHYALSPPGPDVTAEECAHLASLALCVNLDDRLACEDDFQLER